MSLNAFTTCALVATLKSFRRASYPPEIILSLSLLGNCPESRVTRTLYLQEYLYDLVDQQLERVFDK